MQSFPEAQLKKLLLLVAAAVLLAGAPITATASDAPASRIEQLTGDVWMASSADVKAATLYGIELAIELECAISEQSSQGTLAGSAKAGALSPFARGWIAAFPNVSTADIVARVDAWYKANPDKMGRMVLDVIWFELVAPAAK